MFKGTDALALGIVLTCEVIMRWVGAVDDLFSSGMRAIGVVDLHIQLYILLVIVAFYVVLALRAVGGMVGWLMLFLAVLLLLHRAVPGVATDTHWPITTALEQSM